MLQIKNLTILHKKDLHELIKDFNFVLNPGDKAVLIGEEGNGKSTLLKWIYNPEIVEDYIEAAGERVISGERLGYLPQELSVEDQQKTIYEYFCEEERFYNQTPRELAELAASLFFAADFFYSEQKMGTLSGGERIKLSLARILLSMPTVLLLDEPSNDLDLETLLWLEQFLVKTECAVLFISHDEMLIERTANVIVHLEQLKRKTESRATVAKMPYKQYLKERTENFSNQERQALNERREEKKKQEKLRRVEQQVMHAMDVLPKFRSDAIGRLLKKKMKVVKSMERRYEKEAEEQTKLPESEEAIFFKLGDVQMPAKKTVLEYSLEELIAADGLEHNILAKDLFLRVKGGEKVCIIGANGSGKTTLLRQISSVLLARKDLKVCYMPQDYGELLDLKKTPVEYLSVTGDHKELTQIRTYLGSLKFTADEMAHPVAELSGGQKAKVLLLYISLSGADVLLLDEPTRNFSPLSGPVIRRMLKEYNGAIISISHDRKYIKEICNTIYKLTLNGLCKVEKEELDL